MHHFVSNLSCAEILPNIQHVSSYYAQIKNINKHS